MRESKYDFTGQRFGKLVVIKRVKKPTGSNRHGAWWECLCDCSNICFKQGSRFIEGKAKSCGCLKEKQWKYIMSKKRKHPVGTLNSSEYRTWNSMLDRCRNPNNNQYYNYGGRGVMVCEKWLTFKGFFEDMGKKPTLKHSIDRINGNGNYEFSNCRWATQLQQAQNTRRNHRIIYKGKEYIVAELARQLNIHEHTFHHHLTKGHSIEYMLECQKRTAERKVKNKAA